MKEQRTLQIQQKSQSNLVQFVPVQHPISPGLNPNAAEDQRHQKKNLIEGLKQNL
jgi:hypothetical protein